MGEDTWEQEPVHKREPIGFRLLLPEIDREVDVKTRYWRCCLKVHACLCDAPVMEGGETTLKANVR
jgi:hypothetical protein